MKKGFTLIELVSVLTILAVIGLVVTTLVIGIIKDLKEDADKISINNYVNSIAYAVELYNDDNNQIPKWCTIKDDKIFYDQNYDNEYSKDELLCNIDCDSDDCVKYFITSDDVKNNKNNVECSKIVISDEGSIEISNCTVLGREVKNYSYKASIKK